MATKITPKIVYQKTAQHKQLFMLRVAQLIELAPSFAKASILAALGDWNASSVITAAEGMGLEVAKSTRGDRASLPGTIQDLFLDKEVSDTDLLNIRAAVLGVQSAFSEDIYVEDETEDEFETLED
jgi:hypothetical protein